MAQSPPADQLAGVPDEAPAASVPGAEPITMRNLVMPWEDVGAFTPPQDYLRLSRDVLATLSAMVAQGPDQAHLLRSDSLGRLLTAGLAPQTDLVTRGWDAVQATFVVATPRIWQVGQMVMFAPGDSTGDGFPRAYTLTRMDPDGTASVDTPDVALFLAGTLMIAVPAVATVRAAEGLNDRVKAANLFANAGAGATVNIIPAQAGQFLRLHTMTLHFAGAVVGDIFLESTGGDYVGEFNATESVGHFMDFQGLKLGNGKGLQWRNISGVGIGPRGTILYRSEFDYGGG